MSGAIRYLNTDLDLHSTADLTLLAKWLEAQGLIVLACSREQEHRWRAILEGGTDFRTPEDAAIALLDTVEGLSQELRRDWDLCTTRKFNIGYACGDTPPPIAQGIASVVLRRMADMQIDLKVTLYPGEGVVGRHQE